MWRMFGWVALIVLCCATGNALGEEQPDPRLSKAQRAFEEAERLLNAGRYEEALAQAEQTLKVRVDVLGNTHLDVAASQGQLGRVYTRRGNYPRAEPLLLQALAFQEAALGPRHPDVAASLHHVASLYFDWGQYSRAEPLYERALAIREAALGPQHPDVAQSLNNLALLYVKQGRYGRAEPLHERALAIREAALGPRHPDVAQSLNNLANIHDDQGRFGRAEPLYERALAIREASLGPQHPDVAQSLNNLANLYYHQDQYNRAESLQERALAIREAVLGPQHRDVAQSLNNLALIYSKQGQYGRAEPLQKRALAIREAVLGPQHRDVAQSLGNLANIYDNQGQYSQAEPLQERALAIREAALGPQHPAVAQSLNNLANVYDNQGQYSRAEPLYERALAIWQAVYGPQHPFVALALNNLALLHFKQGRYSQAEPLYGRALAIWRTAVGPRHFRVARVLKYLAQLRIAQRQLPRALPLLERAFFLSEQRLRQEALDFSESRLANFLLFLRSEEDFVYSLLHAYPDNVRVQRMALSSALLRKGRSIEEITNTSRTLSLSLGQEDRHAFEQLRGLRTQLASLSHQGPGDAAPADYQQRLQSLAAQGDALETRLAQHSAPLRARSSLPPPAHIVGRVAAALPRDGALVEFVAYTDRPVVPSPGMPAAQVPGEPRYLAFVLLPNARLRTVDLGPAAAIDQATSAFHDALASNATDWQGPSQALYALAFRPLRPLLGKARRLFLSPDGQLHLVPFAALHDGQRPLLDAFRFTYLTSGKELLPRPEGGSPSRSVTVFADPDFGTSPEPISGASPPPSDSVTRSPAPERVLSTLRAEFAERAWMPLPGTRREAEAILQLIPHAQLFLGPDASKQRLLQLPTPGVLHIATHGFFLQDAATAEGARGLGHFGALASAPPLEHLPDPLLRSGLVLAGASTHAPHAPDDSLVTALELAGLDLWGTELVVLSACDTGRGDVKQGQGVYGLRRALVAAGAETVISSLWKVNDETTRELMQGYYRHLLEGSPRVTALHEAMVEARKAHPHPYAWAPFIALGRDAPLRALASSSRGAAAPR